MKVKAIINFNDLEANTHRNIGDVFDVSKERADYLLQHNAIEVVEYKAEVTDEFIDEPSVEVIASQSPVDEIKEPEIGEVTTTDNDEITIVSKNKKKKGI